MIQMLHTKKINRLFYELPVELCQGEQYFRKFQSETDFEPNLTRKTHFELHIAAL